MTSYEIYKEVVLYNFVFADLCSAYFSKVHSYSNEL